jgi:deoxyribodipyrimidine photo-lyase
MPRASARPCIVWFRDDLRLSDHPALHEAARIGAPVICLYVLDEESRAFNTRPLGGAARWWLAQSLRALQNSLGAVGAGLVLRKGAAPKIITELARETGAKTVFWNEIAQAPHQAVADHVTKALEEIGVASHGFAGDLLAAPSTIRSRENRGLRVFTPFWRRVQSLGDPPKPLPAPGKLSGIPGVAGDALENWQLEPSRPDWAFGLRESWTPGEASAQARLKAFLETGVAGYSGNRDRPGRDATSRLSPHLRFGEISPRQLWHAAGFAAAERPRLAADIDKFLSELGWREFCRHLLFDLPDLAERNLQPSFDAFPWKHDDKALRAWQRGRTGYPIVDAGMRELWHTGAMHNRVRMVTASFLVKHLLIDCRCR